MYGSTANDVLVGLTSTDAVNNMPEEFVRMAQGEFIPRQDVPRYGEVGDVADAIRCCVAGRADGLLGRRSALVEGVVSFIGIPNCDAAPLGLASVAAVDSVACIVSTLVSGAVKLRVFVRNILCSTARASLRAHCLKHLH